MANEKKGTNNEVMNEIHITHIFDAPRELVFKAWTDPEQLNNWYAPNNCTVRFKKIDVREGGSLHYCISNPIAGDCWAIGTYKEIVYPERLVFNLMFADEKGNPINPVDRGMDPDWPQDTLVTVTFTEHEGKTTLTLHQTVSETLAKRTGAYPGWIQMLERSKAIINASLNKN